jgi:hypothetical protein
MGGSMTEVYEKYLEKYSLWAELQAIEDVNGHERLGTVRVTNGNPKNWTILYPGTFVSVTFFDDDDILMKNRITVQDNIRLIVMNVADIDRCEKHTLFYKIMEPDQGFNVVRTFPETGKEICGEVIDEYDNEFLGVNIGFPILMGVFNKDLAKELKVGDWIKFIMKGWARTRIFEWRERIEEQDKKDPVIIHRKYLDRELKR